MPELKLFLCYLRTHLALGRTFVKYSFRNFDNPEQLESIRRQYDAVTAAVRVDYRCEFALLRAARYA